MYYRRRYVQFNDLVIDSVDMLTTTEHQVEFKGEGSEYSFGHGSYYVWKRNYPFAKEQSVSLTLKLSMLKVPCEYREFYKIFALGEVTKPGKLWAVVNNTLMWAYAYITSYSESEDTLKDEYILNVDFILPEGVWHKADRYKTFIKPYDVCTFLDCKGFQEVPCEPLITEDTDCCLDCQNRKNDKLAEDENDCSCCCCYPLSKEMALCYNRNVLQDIYTTCSLDWQIEYNCQKANEFFGHLGNKLCTKDTCDNIISGKIYSETEIPTTGVDIYIDGEVHDPIININGNKNMISGDYEGLRVKSNGDVYSVDKDGCCETLLSPSVWIVPNSDEEYGWTIKQGINKVIIDRGSCCGRACAYIQTDNLTI